MQDYDGATVVDAAGARIGRVERSYVDEDGTVHFVEVKLGALLAKHRLVPATAAHFAATELVVPYTHDAIVASPDAVAAGDTLEGPLLAQVRAYYADDRAGRAGTTQTREEHTEPDAGNEDSRGDGRRGEQNTAPSTSNTMP